MLYAFMEGLAGIEDKLKLYQEVKLSPRWSITEEEVGVIAKYGTSDLSFRTLKNAVFRIIEPSTDKSLFSLS